MLGWLSKLKRAILRQAPAKSDEEISAEVDKFITELIEVFPMQNKHRGRLEFNVGDYSLSGGWLSDSFYFDMYDKRVESQINKLGRIYVGYELFSSSIKWSSYKSGKDKKVTSSNYIINPKELLKEDLVKSINFIIPNLIKE